MQELKRIRIEISGVVQGVGFRPFVYRLASELGLEGYVLNHDRGVRIEAQGESSRVEQLLREIPVQAPPASRIQALAHEWLSPALAEAGAPAFEIRESLMASREKFVAISPDLALCEDCRREIRDPANRRYFYPFTNCTNCGPRFSIIRDVPYDRPATTMAPFRMCPDCQAEYDDPANRRFHAQPNACAQCGPKLELSKIEEGRSTPVVSGDSETLLREAVLWLRNGRILAIKGIGGFHLACDARNEAAVQRLRARKVRERKPFAVMFPFDREHKVWTEVKVSAEEGALLRSSAAPIVLLDVAARAGIAPSVAPENRKLGVLLPYTPLHELLMTLFDGPLVMTSGNRSDEAICRTNEQAFERLAGIADAFLVHDREIHLRCDDSVVRPGTLFRRSRGYAPQALDLHKPFVEDILSVGAELKNTFCFGRQGRKEALVSQHIGDLESLSNLEAFEAGVDHFRKIFGIDPQVVAHDLHPDYLNTKWATERFARRYAIQHHHAHLAACLEENGFAGPVIGVALDGTGYGTDGSVWGGEILVADRRDFRRLGHLRTVRLPAGASALKHPWRLALAYLHAAGLAGSLPESFRSRLPETEAKLALQALEKGLRLYESSSCGRLFDAVSALSGCVEEVFYEGQAAIELEKALTESDPKGYSFRSDFASGVIDWHPVFHEILADLRSGAALGRISGKFHSGLVSALTEFVVAAGTQCRIDTVALSGGCFLNEFISAELSQRCEARGLRVLRHRELPPGDGCISFGQAVVVNQILRGEESCVSRFQ